MTEFTTRDRERLVRVEDSVGTLCRKLDKFMQQAESDTGFPRCAARSVQWDNIKKHQAKVENFITWFYRGLVVTALVLLITEGFTYAKALYSVFSKITPGEFP